MDLEQLKSLWNQNNRDLEASLRLNTLLLERANLRETQGLLKRLARGMSFEVAVNAVAVLLAGSFAADHVTELRFLIPALVVAAYALGLVAAGIVQLVALRKLDYDEPVVAIQASLERLRLARIRTTLAILLSAPLLWVPLLVVCARAAFGIDVYAAASPGWLAANLLVGLSVIPLGMIVARRWGTKIAQSSPMRRFADDVAGRSLVDALASLDSIRRFAEE